MRTKINVLISKVLSLLVLGGIFLFICFGVGVPFVANAAAPDANVLVYIGPTLMNSGSPYTLSAGQSTRQSYAGVNAGVVALVSDTPVVASERFMYSVNGTFTSFSEMMGMPRSHLDKTYWLPWYNNVDLDTKLMIANVDTGFHTAIVHVFIGGTEVLGSPFTFTSGQSRELSFAGVNDGVVKIVSNVNIVVSERVIYNLNSYSEMMALADSRLCTTYWMPWYNNVGLNSQMRIGNVSLTDATVNVYIGGTKMTGSPFVLTPGQSVRQSYAGVIGGPVKVVSDVPVIAAMRVMYPFNGGFTTFSEMMGLPDNQKNATYWFPWYNNENVLDLDTQLRFANVGATDATVNVYIGGTLMPGGPFVLAPGESTRQSFAGVNGGPVQVVSDVNIVASERFIYNVNGVNKSFSEMMGLPEDQLGITFVMPWYNNVGLNTQLRFGNVR